MSKDKEKKKKSSGSSHRSRKSLSSGVRSPERRSSERELPEGGRLDKGRFPTSNDESKHAVSPPGDRLDDNSPGKRSNCSSGSGYEDKQHFEPIYRATDKYGSTGSPTGRPEDLIDGLVPDNQLKSPKGKTPGKGDSTGRPAGLPVVSSASNVLDSQDIPYSRPTPVLKAGHQYVAIPSEYDSVYSSDPTGHVLNSSIANVSVGSSTGLNVPNPPGLNLRHTMTTDQNMVQDGRGMSRGFLPRNPGLGFNTRCPTFSSAGMRFPIPNSQNCTYVFSDKNIMSSLGYSGQFPGLVPSFQDNRYPGEYSLGSASGHPEGFPMGYPYGFNVSGDAPQRQSVQTRHFSNTLKSVSDSQGNTVFVRDNSSHVDTQARKSRYDEFYSGSEHRSSSSEERSRSKRKSKKKHKKRRKHSHKHESSSPYRHRAKKESSPPTKRKHSSSGERSPDPDQISIIVKNNEFDGESDSDPPRNTSSEHGSRKESLDSMDTEEIEPRISYSDIIQEVFKLLPSSLCPPSDTPVTCSRPRSSIERLKPMEEKQSSSLPQSLMIADICSSLNKLSDGSKKDPKFKPNWTVSKEFLPSLGVKMKYYNIHKTVFPTEAPPIDSDASVLDLSVPNQIGITSSFMETLENRSRNIVSINSYADLFAAAAFNCLSSESMDANILSKLLESLVNCIKHSTSLAVVMATELLVSRKEAAINSSKILSQTALDSLRKVPLTSNSLFGGQIATIQKANSEAFTSKFIASSVAEKSKEKDKPLSDFKIPKVTPKKAQPKKETPKLTPAPRRGGGSSRGSRGGAQRGRGKQTPSHFGASKPKST